MRLSLTNLELRPPFDLDQPASSLGTDSAIVTFVIRELCMVT